MNKTTILLITLALMLFSTNLVFAESKEMNVAEAKKLCAPFEFTLNTSDTYTLGQKKFFNDIKSEVWKICASKLEIDSPYNNNFHELASDQIVVVLSPNYVGDQISIFQDKLKDKFKYEGFILSTTELSDNTSSSDSHNKQCLEVAIPGYKTVKIFCTFATSQNQSTQETTSKNKCIMPTVKGSKVEYNMTAKVIECIKEGMDQLFIDYSNDGSEAGIFKDLSLHSFHKFQESFRNIVRIALVLYIIFFGIKIITSDNMPEKSDIFSFLLKFVLVLYFAVGITPDKIENGVVQRQDGVTQILKPIFFNMTDFLSNIVLKSSGDIENNVLSNSNSKSGICNLSTDYQSEFQYLAIWDKIDCRLINYLGISKGYFAKILVLFFSLEFISFTIFICVFVFLLSIIIFFIQIYALSLIALTVLTFISPIFVICILFERTKGFFDNWLKLCISFILQPLIIVVFISLTFLTFDMLIFKGCGVETDQYGYITVTPGASNYTQDNDIPSAINMECERSVGYLLYHNNNFVEYKGLLFLAIASIGAEAKSSLIERLSDLFEFFLFLSLFSMFAESLGNFAADLTDGIAISQMTMGPKALYNKAMELRNAGVSKLQNKLQRKINI